MASKCETFNPQRFRPNFCKTCMKTKSEHVQTPRQDTAAQTKSPEPQTRTSITQSAPLKRGSLRKPPVGVAPTPPMASGDNLKKRLSGVPNRNYRFSRQLKSGFVAKQQAKSETPNANRFFIQALRGLLSEGIGLSQNETEDLVRRVIASNAIPDDPKEPKILINNKRASYLEEFINTAQDFMEEQRNLRRIIIVQSQARRYLVSRRFGSMTPEAMAMMRKRNAVYIELVRTEKKFVESTDDLISRFIVKMRQSDVVAPNECAFIFSNIEVVAEEHRALLNRIIKAGDNWPFVGNIGAIFLDIKSLLNAISVYVSNFKNAMNEIERISSENPRFNAFCNQQMAENDGDLTMGLAMPVNRIAQYEYVLRSLADHTPEGSERDDCENAFAVLAQSSLVVQTSLVESGETARILAVQRKMKSDGPMALIKSGRRLLDEIKMKKHSVCLFNDLVVVSRLPPAKGFGTGRVHKQREDFLKVKKIGNLNNCTLNEPKNDKFLELIVEDETFKLMPPSTTVRKEFITLFRNAVDELNRSKVFGVALCDTVSREKPPDGIPLLLRRCISFIEENYLTQAGIFRIAGATKETTLLRETFDRGGEDAQNVKLSDKSVHSLCDIIKSYLRSLPEPLLSYNVYNPLVQLMKDQSNDKSTQIKKIKSQLKHTPEVSLKVLRYLIKFLQKVSAHSEENKMTNSNLSIVFGPTLLWPKENSLESAMDMPYVNSVIQILLESPSKTIPRCRTK